MEHLAACPLCQETRFSLYASCKDYTVSHETFTLQQCQACGFVFTNPRPDAQTLPQYYQSDSYISHAERSKSVTDNIYRVARTFTLKWKYRVVMKHSSMNPKTLLDFGCGTGAFLEACQQKGLRIRGVEPAEIARQQAARNTGTVVAKDLMEVRETFDAITLWHVLEHVTHLQETLEALSHHLNQNGTMFIAVPNLKSSDAQHYQNQWAAYDVPRHLWHFSKESMRNLLANHNLHLEGVLPMPLDAYYVCLLSEKYRSQKQNIATMATAALQGWKSNQSAKRTGEYSSLIYIVRK